MILARIVWTLTETEIGLRRQRPTTVNLHTNSKLRVVIDMEIRHISNPRACFFVRAAEAGFEVSTGRQAVTVSNNSKTRLTSVAEAAARCNDLQEQGVANHFFFINFLGPSRTRVIFLCYFKRQKIHAGSGLSAISLFAHSHCIYSWHLCDGF